jgi:hypothetical protein
MRSSRRRWQPVDPAAVSFCERCGVACDARCRADSLREQARARTLAFQMGRR